METEEEYIHNSTYDLFKSYYVVWKLFHVKRTMQNFLLV